MLHPSYTELMKKINSEEYRGDEPAINSRYSIVIATSKRARELIAGAKPLVEGMEDEKPLSIAVKELYDGKIKIMQEDEEVDFDDDLMEMDDMDAGEAEGETDGEDVPESEEETGEADEVGDETEE